MNDINIIKKLILECFKYFDFQDKLYVLEKSYWLDLEFLKKWVDNNCMIKYKKSICFSSFHLAKNQLLQTQEIIQTQTIQLRGGGVLNGDFISLNYEDLILTYLKKIGNQEDSLANITNYLKQYIISISSTGVSDILKTLSSKIYKSCNKEANDNNHKYKLV